MATTYNYATGQINTDLRFRRSGEPCKLAQLPTRVGSQWCLQYCPHKKGSLFLPPQLETYIFCNHPDASDSEGSEHARAQFYEDLEMRALSAL